MLKMLEGDMIIRVDSMGDGHYLAPRGNHQHKGVDYIVTPGEIILMPFNGYLVREARPYSDSALSGAILQSRDLTLKVLYFNPLLHRVGHILPAGTIIGHADDIRIKHGSRMTPHIHVEVIHMNVNRLWGL